jgi:uncharacterized protein (TIGR02270 family)
VPPADAVWAAGFAGTVAAADACVSAMRSGHERILRLAGEAFSAITGLRIERHFAAEEPAEPEEPIPFELEDLDADLVPAPERSLPLPDPHEVVRWWRRQREGLRPGTRYLDGRELGAESLLAALEAGPMRRRHAHALDLAIRTRGALRIPTRAWTRDQRTSPGALAPADLRGGYRHVLAARRGGGPR